MSASLVATSAVQFLIATAGAVSYENSLEAERFVNGLGSQFGPDVRSAILHTYWFSLNQYDNLEGDFGLNEGNLVSLGQAHESDYRQSYLDSAKDLANNSIGVDIGNQAYDLGASRTMLDEIVVRNISQLNCVVGDSFGAPTSC